MRRKNIKIRQFPLMGARINSTYIGRQCKKIFVTGDSLNNIHLYAFDSDQQITCFSSSTSANNVQNQTSAVAINYSEDQVFSGSNRGIINIWDIKTGKSNILLKGHSTSVNCFGVFPCQSNRVASGSYDTNIKIWDIREKNNNATLKGHSKQVNSIQISPDGKMLFSGSEDNTIKLWDLRYPQKILYTYTDHTGPITKVICHPEDMMFASCSMDKTAKYFRCQPPSHCNYLSSTEMVSTPITAITFDQQGQYLFTAANDVLKCWSMINKGVLMESIQSPWKGVQDLCWKQNGVLGIAANNQYLSIWAFDTKQKNTRRAQKSQYSQPLILPNIHRKNDIQKDLFQALQNVQKANQIMANCQINAIRKKPYQKIQQKFQKKPRIEEQKIYEYQPEQNIEEQINVNINTDQEVTQRTIPKINMKISPSRNSKQQNNYNANNFNDVMFKNNQNQENLHYVDKDSQEKYEQLNQNYKIEKNMPSEQLYQNIEKRLSQQDHQFDMTVENDVLENSSVMNISTFVGNSQQREKLKQIQLIGEICKDIGKFQNVMSQRLKIIKSFLHLWKIGRAPKSFQILRQVDQGIIYDCLSAVIKNNNYKNGITPENAVKMLQLLTQLMKNKHATYVKGAMQLINQIVNLLKNQVIKVRNFNSMSKVDPSRQQRVAKIDRLIEQFYNVFKQDRLKKYSSDKLQTQNQDLVTIAKQLYKNLQQVLRALTPRRQPQAA